MLVLRGEVQTVNSKQIYLFAVTFAVSLFMLFAFCLLCKHVCMSQAFELIYVPVHTIVPLSFMNCLIHYKMVTKKRDDVSILL